MQDRNLCAHTFMFYNRRVCNCKKRALSPSALRKDRSYMGHNERGHVGRTGAVFSVNCYFNSRNPISIQEKPVPARLFPR